MMMPRGDEGGSKSSLSFPSIKLAYVQAIIVIYVHIDADLLHFRDVRMSAEEAALSVQVTEHVVVSASITFG